MIKKTVTTPGLTAIFVNTLRFASLLVASSKNFLLVHSRCYRFNLYWNSHDNSRVKLFVSKGNSRPSCWQLLPSRYLLALSLPPLFLYSPDMCLSQVIFLAHPPTPLAYYSFSLEQRRSWGQPLASPSALCPRILAVHTRGRCLPSFFCFHIYIATHNHFLSKERPKSFSVA